MSSEVSWKQEHKLIDLEEKPNFTRVFTANNKKINLLLLSVVHGYSSDMKVSLNTTVNCLVGCFSLCQGFLQLVEG